MKGHEGVCGGGKDAEDSESTTFGMVIPKLHDRKNLPLTGSCGLDDGTFILDEPQLPATLMKPQRLSDVFHLYK